jgi:predicted O-methyltransferase YrrM
VSVPVRDPRPVTPSTILASELDAVCRDLEDTPGVDARTLARLVRARDLAGGLDPYLDRCTTAESPALADLARRTAAYDWQQGLEQEMLSGHVEGRLLQFLLRMSGARRVLEIGMFTGYSALAMAEALPSDGVLVACEIDSVAAGFARQAFAACAAGAKVTVELGPALDTLHALAEAADRDPREAFDFVFVDADKPGYRSYLDLLLDTPVLAPDGVIALDNTLMQGEPYLEGVSMSVNGAAIAEFNRSVSDDPRVEQVLVPLRDGLTLIRRVDAGCR